MILLDGESTGANSASSAMSCRPVSRRGAPHTFANGTDEDVPVLMFVTPAGFERYFADGAARARPPDESTIVIGGRLDEEQGSISS